MSKKVFNVLFLCTGNSARSIMAEALLNKLGAGRFNAFSAGSHPTGEVNPHTIERLEKEGVLVSNARSKSWDEFNQPESPELDLVITICDNVASEVRPIWKGQPITAHWGIPDPIGADENERRIEFAKTFVMLERRIQLLTSLNPDNFERMALQHEVREIGQTVKF
ncbi:MAG: arsenate reductase ArsC [Methylococcales bacterium]|nr:MAG: arsenate reductase ArsC [Methylococcales bacterium]